MHFQSLAGKDYSGGALAPALAVSLVLHALLLGTVPPRPVERTSGSLAVTLRAAPAAAGVEHAAPIVETEKSPPAKVSPARTAVVSAPARSLPAAEAPRAAAERAEADDSAGGTPDPAAPQEALAAAPAGSAGRAAGIDPDGIRAYRIGLAREARNHRNYPPLARERGWSGTVEIEVDVSREGAPRQILLARSSGHEILDRAALTMMSLAAAAATLPESLRGQAFAVRLPVVFDLTEAHQ